MITSGLVIQMLTYLVPLVAGYLLRHYGINIPGLPSAPTLPSAPSAPSSTSAPAANADHVGLLQQVLGVAKSEAEALLKQAVQGVIAKGLTDLKSASAAPAAPAK